MRIVIIAGSNPSERIGGGAEYQAMMIAKGLADKGHQVLFLATSSTGPSEQRLGALRIVNLQRRSLAGKQPHREAVESTVREFSPDICYVRRFMDLALLAVICRSSGFHLISASSHSRETSPFLPSRSADKTIRHLTSFLSISSSRVHVCISKLLRKQIRGWYPRHEIRTIYNGQPGPPSESFRYGSTGQIIWVNNLKTWKRPELFINLASHYPQYNFVMVGRMPKNRYRAKISKLLDSSPSNLTYIGPKTLEEVNMLIEGSDLLVYTSRATEGFGNSFIQAWFRGVPTLSLSHELDGILEREGIGRCSKDYDQMVNDVGELMANDRSRGAMGKSAREYAERNHNLDTLILNYESLFDEIVQ